MSLRYEVLKRLVKASGLKKMWIGKSTEELARLGLSEMESWMKEIGLVMNISELGVTEDMIDGIADGTFLLDGGYKVLTRSEVVEILKSSM